MSSQGIPGGNPSDGENTSKQKGNLHENNKSFPYYLDKPQIRN